MLRGGSHDAVGINVLTVRLRIVNIVKRCRAGKAPCVKRKTR
jgi:hypothetical protein